ncbi:MAG: Lrp/AsnC family transcriptional regulator [Amaricoccus sp.]
MQGGAEIDSFDRKLLAALQDDGRLTNQELGERIGLSPSQCSRRRQALEEAGLIRGYRAELAAEALGLNILVFIEVNLTSHNKEAAERFHAMLRRVDSVQEAYALSGEVDYLLKAIVPDLKGVQELVNETLLGHATVTRVCTSIVLNAIKTENKLPVPAKG